MNGKEEKEIRVSQFNSFILIEKNNFNYGIVEKEFLSSSAIDSSESWQKNWFKINNLREKLQKYH